MKLVVISHLQPDDQAAVLALLARMRRCAGLALTLRAQLAALMLLPASEMREEIEAVMRREREEVEA